ncbi:MAG: RluA family pseudouridine synthase [bacterium]|nr:RluA family pseudouridine synthase [bacterium]MDD5353987.1 RluA family pseudouridine synthase [bacterium]
MEKTKEQIIEFTASKNSRLDMLLAEKLSQSRALAQKIIREQGVCRIAPSRKMINKTGYKTSVGEMFRVNLPELKELPLAAEKILLSILYEDKSLIVLDKPAGMMVHPVGRIKTGTLVNALLDHCQGLSQIGGCIRPGIVHRLDKDTSGVMVIAKSDAAHRHLSRQFARGQIKKTYLALVHGRVSSRHGVINARIVRGRTDRTKMKVSATAGRPAVTEYEVVKQYPDMALLRLFPRTGRTHQIRVHLVFIGHPIVGDWKYGPKLPTSRSARQLLHAESISFIHPETKEHLRFQADLPADIKGAITVNEMA